MNKLLLNLLIIPWFDLLDTNFNTLELIGEMEIFRHYHNRFCNSYSSTKYSSIYTISKYHLCSPIGNQQIQLITHIIHI